MTLAPPPVAAAARRSRTWLWALGTILVVALVWGGAYTAHHLVASRVLASARLPAPASPPAAIAAVLRPEAGAAFVAAVGESGELVLLAGPQEPACPPSGACGAAPALDTLLVVNGRTGATIAQAPLVGAAQHPVALAVDARRGIVDVISANAVDVFALGSGAHLVTFALPAGDSAGPETGAIVTSSGTLLLTASNAGQPALLGVDALHGTPRFSFAPAAGVARLDGPVYDPATGLVVLIEATFNATNLLALDATHGTLRARTIVPAGVRLGPLDPATDTLYLFLRDGGTDSVKLADLAAAAPPPATAPTRLTPDAALAGARALGWNAALGHVYLADARGLRTLDGVTGRTLAALPLPVAWPPDAALPVDGAGLLFVPSDHGAIAVVRDSANLAIGVTPATAAVLARAALATLPPHSAQDPPFVAPATFTIGPGSRTLDFYAYDPDFGTNGPYSGSAQLAVAPIAGSPGAYNVTFTVSWNLRFLHTDSWVYAVDPNGAVRLVSQAGDPLP
ncbi:MAG TPA: hypothetical protein VGN32_08615 [Ktedonobacterales bacterium]|nr:hypothetical protein [Ktedonobacterales bacterium]